MDRLWIDRQIDWLKEDGWGNKANRKMKSKIRDRDQYSEK